MLLPTCYLIIGSELQRRQQQQQQQQKWWWELDAERATPTPCRSACGSGHDGSESFFFERQVREQERGRESSSSSSNPVFPDPWQGNIDLPQNDEEIINTAQVWGCVLLPSFMRYTRRDLCVGLREYAPEKREFPFLPFSGWFKPNISPSWECTLLLPFACYVLVSRANCTPSPPSTARHGYGGPNTTTIK